MPRVIFQCFADENLDATPYGVVELTPQLVALIGKRVAAFQGMHEDDRDLVTCRFHDLHCEFTGHDDGGGAPEFEELYGEDWVKAFEEDGHNTEPGVFHRVTYSYMRTETDTMNVDREGVWWSAHQKHTSLKMETQSISIEKLKEILDAHAVPPADVGKGSD